MKKKKSTKGDRGIYLQRGKFAHYIIVSFLLGMGCGAIVMAFAGVIASQIK